MDPYLDLDILILDFGEAGSLSINGCLLAQGPTEPQLKLLRLHHAPPSQLPVLPLAAFVPGLATSP